MALIDRQGRLLRRVSLLDLGALLLLLVVAAPPVSILRTLFGWKEIAISDIEPQRIEVGASERHGPISFITIKGSGFTRDCIVKLSEHVLGHPSAVTPSSLRVGIPDTMPPGLYQVVVAGPRRTAGSIEPITVSWQPAIASVKPGDLHTAQERTLTISGDLFEPGCEVSLGGQKISEVEYVNRSLLRVTIGPHRFPPKEYVLSAYNPVSGLQADAPAPVRVQGEEFFPVLVTLRLEGVTRPNYEKLLELSHLHPVTANRVHFIHLGPVPPWLPPPKDQEPHELLSNWDNGPSRRPAKPPKTISFLANAGLHAKLVYSDEGVRVVFADNVLKVGTRFVLIFGDLQYSAVVLTPPVVLSRAQAWGEL